MFSEDVGAVCGAQGHPIATPPLAEHNTNKLLMPQGLYAVKAACAALVIVNCYSCFLRLLLFCTWPPLCAGALWPMPAWVWRDVRFFSFFFFCF